jgi:hypothetical protein
MKYTVTSISSGMPALDRFIAGHFTAATVLSEDIPQELTQGDVHRADIERLKQECLVMFTACSLVLGKLEAEDLAYWLGANFWGSRNRLGWEFDYLGSADEFGGREAATRLQIMAEALGPATMREQGGVIHIE